MKLKMEGQKYYGPTGLTVVIAIVTALMPTSIEIYLPALPGITRYFDTSQAAVNATLVVFFAGFAGSMLVWGPLSDKYGRKRILMIGLVLYTLANIACACSTSILQLILFRLISSIGAGAAEGVNIAILKDVFTGRRRERALAVMMTLVLVAPVIAPTLGAVLLLFMPWRGIFWALALTGLACLILSHLITETIPERYDHSLAQAMSRIGTVLKNPRFTSLMVIFSALMLPAMGFVAASSYIYIDKFGLSEFECGLYYSVIAIFRIAGPYIYIIFSRHFSTRPIITCGFAGTMIGGFLLATFGSLGPVWFTLALIPIIPGGPMLRPAGAHLMLEQQTRDTGTASSLINSSPLFFGGIGILTASFARSELIIMLAGLCVVVGGITTISWLMVSKKSFVTSVIGPHKARR